MFCQPGSSDIPNRRPQFGKPRRLAKYVIDIFGYLIALQTVTPARE